MIYYITSQVSTNLNRIVPLNITLAALAIGTDLNITSIPYPCMIQSVAVYAKTVVGGTFTLTLSNAAGTTVATCSTTSSGLIVGSVSVPSIAANDRLRVNITSVSLTLSTVNLTVWLALT